MTGALWAIVAGVGFGIFQTLNRRAVHGMDVFVATFMQLAISAGVLIGISVLTVDISPVWTASPSTLIYFALAGLLHFFIGWTFLNSSQKRIGAARTSALIGTTPLFAAVISLFTLGEVPSLYGIGGMLLIVAGVFVTTNPLARPADGEPTDSQKSGRWIALALGLAAPLFWAISPTFTRLGLQGLHSPLLGVTIGMIASTLCYAVAIGVRSLRTPIGAISMDSIVFKVAAGVLVGLSTWLRWIAIDLAPVAFVIALTLVSVPTVNLLTPLVVDHKVEQVTATVWGGSLLVVAGSLILTLTG